MVDLNRWMIRPKGKLPESARETRPIDYEPPAGKEDPNSAYWRHRWTVPAVWTSYEEAASYVARHMDVEGLSFVLYPAAGEYGRRKRIICFDFDHCFTDGALDPAVADFLDTVGSFAERSRSGNGLHVFVIVECEAFTNNLAKPIGGCKVDVMCSAQIAVTGDVYDGHEDLVEVPFAFVQNLPFFAFKEAKEDSEHPDWWAEDPIEEIPERLQHLAAVMEDWPTAVEGERGSEKLFAAASRLIEHGVTGREAEALLGCVPAIPAFEGKQIRRTIECAYARVTAEGGVNTKGPENEFPLLAVPDIIPEDPDDYGFNPIPVGELMQMDLKLEYLVDRAFVGEGSLFIGGREKCFKTGVVFDLIISLATGKPFLGEFEVLDHRTSVVFTAEIGLPSAQALIGRVAESKGIDVNKLNGFDVVDTIPSFSTDKHSGKFTNEVAMSKLQKYLDRHKPQVAVFDPLYFAMGGAGVGDMYEVGQVLRNISKICTERKIWAVFCHHARKASREDEAQPMELHDLYGSGVGAYARQWALLSHAQPFRNGVASLYMNMGGSAAGDRGLWRLTIDEGQDEAILGRKWNVSIEAEDFSEAGTGTVTDEALVEAIRALDGGKGVTTSELQFFIQAENSAVVDKALRLAMKREIVEMKGGKKFSIKEQACEEFDG